MSFSSSQANSLYSDLRVIRENRPLIHSITNQVASNFTANVLLALGASPLMAHDIRELGETLSLSSSLVLNIGTLNEDQIVSMECAIGHANTNSIPIVIDPVGSGASQLRTQTAKNLLSQSENCLLKGNASEINSLVLSNSESKGVDSLEESDKAVDCAKTILKKFNLNAVIITGEKDFVISPLKKTVHFNGDKIMSRVTGMGCALTAVVSAFSSVNFNYSEAARNAVSLFGIVGQLARRKSYGPGSFQSCFLDILFSIGHEDIHKEIKVELC